MITREEFMSKVEELSKITQEDMMQMGKVLCDHGINENPEFENNYILPKIFFMAYAARLRDIWSPWGNRHMNPKINKIVKEIEKLI